MDTNVTNTFAFCALFILLVSCSPSPDRPKEEAKEEKQPPLFTLLPPDSTHIHFANTLTEGLNTNVLMYEYFYNGGGVATGDVNGDGLDDIYFTANMAPNKLYLNKGNLQFEDITTPAGVSGRPGPWKTGVTMADVNADGLLDIYVCYSGSLPPEKRKNQLFINQGADEAGIPHFSEQAEAFGIASTATSTHAVFFDYDKDGRLDMFLLNHNPASLPVLNEVSTAGLLEKPDTSNGSRLYRNNRGHFNDVTERAGITGSALSYGLGAGVADINADGWPDLYISNDYDVPDYLYINNKDGTFSNRIQTSVGHTAHFSMGNDVADINNDGLVDIFTLDMLPEDNKRQKLLLAPDNYAKFDFNLRAGFHYQYMRNMLHVNQGNGTFGEVGQLAGVSNTDWSWAPLLADFDNDGLKDLFVTNGYLRDYTNLDFIKYMDDFVQHKKNLKRNDVFRLVHKMPSTNVTNYMFKNNGDLTFANVVAAWGLDVHSNSNGAAYADLDNDGDLDLVVNNINMPAFVYANRSDELPGRHYLKVKLEGTGGNTMGVGARVILYCQGRKQYLEQMPARGYQSAVSPVLHFGLGSASSADSLYIAWPEGGSQLLKNVKADRLLVLKEKESTSVKKQPERKSVPALFQEIATPVDFKHHKVAVNDFKRQPLLVNPFSFSGPCMAKADVNADGLDDIYVGGAAGQPGMLYIQAKGGTFSAKTIPAFNEDKMSDDTDAAFFDADNDGHADLYVCSGGYHNFEPGDALLQDRLYLNDGKGTFYKAKDHLPTMPTSTACVRAADINGDGYSDLFIGGRVIPGRYPEPPRSYLLVNDTHGRFNDMTKTIAPSLQQPGLVTDAAWADLNSDQAPDLVVAGEWMPLSVYINENGTLVNKTDHYFTQPLSGWWNRLAVADFNNDGHIDIVAGNLGLNSQCKATEAEPIEMYYKDFDDNGSVDPILCMYIQGISYPYLSRDELLDQLSMMRARFTDYRSFSEATLKDVFRDEEMTGATHMRINTLETTYLQGSANGTFHKKDLPLQAQWSPVFTITPLDYNRDGYDDLLLCGNITHARLRFGKYDANYGLLLQNDGAGNFTYIPQRQSGFALTGDVRSVVRVGDTLLFGMNSGRLMAYREK